MRAFGAIMIKYPPKIKKPEIGQIKATQEKNPRGLFVSNISIRVSYGIIITPEQEKSKTGNGARIAEFRVVRPLSAFFA